MPLTWRMEKGDTFTIPVWAERVTVVEIDGTGVKVRFDELDPLDAKLLAKDAHRKLDAKTRDE